MNHPFRIILVEGVPFTGKSTTSEYITTQLGLNGYPARWISEGTLFQRHFTQTMAMTDQEKPFSTDIWHDEWQSFIAAAQASDEVLVVDSSLSYVGVLPLMTEDWPNERIAAEFTRIAALFAPLRPRVIHLTGDVDRLVPASIVDRGEAWHDQMIRQSDCAPYQQARGRSGLEGAIAMLRESQAVTAELLARDGWQALSLDVTDRNWAAHQRAILDFLDLREVVVERPEIERSVLEAYAGTYLSDDPAKDDRPLVVELEGDTLILGAPRQRYGPLVPLSPTRFHLRASPIDVEFAAGEGRRLTLLWADGRSESFHRA
ncbi:MAG TPA: hypothetical protein VD886_16435 [Herpetosiphonaceae bacterium]|nr:hypothetical protein [Herpetosiphonaceae bacterium]